MNLQDNTLTRPPLVLWIGAGLLACVYLLGVTLPLYASDSSHHALIGMHMYLTGDYVSLIDRGRDYLDKPHLLFWSAALGDSLFGVGTLAFKLPSLLVSMFGVYATYRLGKRLYSAAVGRNAAIILVTTQAYILGLNDIRMDALLLSFIILATWTLYEFSLSNRLDWLLLGSFTLAMAFSTKGMSGAAVPVIAVGSQILYSRNWTFLRSFRWLWAIPLFFLFASPVLYAYYLQFDLHPEKVIRGMTNISGLAFIMFYQNVERLEGTNWGSNSGSDSFFFFHTALWALLPWCLLAYWAVFRRGVGLWRERLAYVPGREMLTITTIVLMFTLLNMSNFKLPHYLNILFPFFSILIAGQLETVMRPGTQKGLVITQKFVVVVMVLLLLFINLYLVPVQRWWVAALAVIALVLLVREWLYTKHWKEKLVGISAAVAVFTNLLMNGNFYAELGAYQSGIHLADKVKELQLDPDEVRYYHWDSFLFNYYSAHFYKTLQPNDLAAGKPVWLVGPKTEITTGLDSLGVKPLESFSFQDFSILNLKPKFVDPATRDEATREIVLVKVAPARRAGNGPTE